MQVGRALKRARMAAPRKKALVANAVQLQKFRGPIFTTLPRPVDKTNPQRKISQIRSAPPQPPPHRHLLLLLGTIRSTRGVRRRLLGGRRRSALQVRPPLSRLDPLSLCYLPLHAVVVGKGHGRTSEFMSGSLNRLLPSPSSASIWPNIFLMYSSLILD